MNYFVSKMDQMRKPGKVGCKRNQKWKNIQTYGLENYIVYSYGTSLVVCQKLANLVNICN